MTQRFSLQTLLELSEQRLDDAARELMELKRVWIQAEEKLQQLRSYEGEYRSRLHQSAHGGFSVTLLRDYQVFLGKIAQAISLQEEEVVRCRLRWQEQETVWREADREVQAYGVLRSRYMQQLRVQEGRREQKDMDEWAGKSFQAAARGSEG